MIPESKKEPVTRALREAFGLTGFEQITPLTAGLSPALVFRIEVRGSPYLLRIVTDTGAAAGPGRGDQTHHYACMRMAADAGIGPRVWYSSIEDRVSLTDFIAAHPFPRTEALAQMPATIRTLHALPSFPSARSVNYLEVMDRFVRKFPASKFLPETEAEELLRWYASIAAVYPRLESDMVPSHNDLKPENILFDGHRPWLVDWEAAFRNDRFLDLAVVANFVVTNDAEEDAFLHTYFGEPAGDYRRARLYLMRQLLHIFYPAAVTLFGLAGKTPGSSETTPDFRGFHDRIWTGEIDLASNDAKLTYTKVHLNRFLHNLRDPRFHDALRIVSD